MATLCSFFDPSAKQAREAWWKRACMSRSDEDGGAAAAAAADDMPLPKAEVAQFNRAHLLRRSKKDLPEQLPPKSQRRVRVPMSSAERDAYLPVEARFLKTLKIFTILVQSAVPAAGPLRRKRTQKLKRMFMQLTMMMQSMRMKCLHPVLSGNGREVTHFFSPSRESFVIKSTKRCFLCEVENDENPEETAAARRERRRRDGAQLAGGGGGGAGDVVYGSEGDDDDMNAGVEDDDDDDDDSDDEDEQDKGPLVHIRDDICGCNERHYAHAACLARVQQDSSAYPFKPKVEHACSSAVKAEAGGALSCGRCVALREKLMTGATRGGVLCNASVRDANDVRFDGFRESTKLRALRARIKAVPPGDKVIVFSFFKGWLDLVEAMLCDDAAKSAAAAADDDEDADGAAAAGGDRRAIARGVCERFDGDVDADEKAAALRRFQAATGPRVLLATVQSGGVGLNIVVANHVIFCDRWFNPCMMEQAIDRTHRIGQTKPVTVTYLDSEDSFDVIMRAVMRKKANNAKVVLGDGTDIGDIAAGGGLGYQEASGTLLHALEVLCGKRKAEATAAMDGGAVPVLEGDAYESEDEDEDDDFDLAVRSGAKQPPRRPVAPPGGDVKPEPKPEVKPSAEPAHSNDFDNDDDDVQIVDAPSTNDAWTCATCTFENDERVLRCGMCDTPMWGAAHAPVGAPPLGGAAAAAMPGFDDQLDGLKAMGFSEECARVALRRNDGDGERAANELLS